MADEFMAARANACRQGIFEESSFGHSLGGAQASKEKEKEKESKKDRD